MQQWAARSSAAPYLATSAAVVCLWALALRLDSAFFWRDDFQSEILPVLRDMAGATSKGELPLLSTGSWFGGDLAGEHRFGVFSPFQLATVWGVFALGLRLPNAAAVLVLIQLLVLANGAVKLARFHGVSGAYATVAGLTASFNGWMLSWGARSWFGALTSFAWLPWVWWALAAAFRSEDRKRGYAVLAGGFLSILIGAGWPHTDLMAAMTAAVLLFWEAARRRGMRSLWPVAILAVIGLGLSAPAWLAFLEYLPYTARPSWRGLHEPWSLPWKALPGLLIPWHRCQWFAFTKPVVRGALELQGAWVPLAGVILGALSGGSRYLKKAAVPLSLAGLSLLLAATPSVAVFRFSFRWLPLFFLSIGLAGALGLNYEGGRFLRFRGRWTGLLHFAAAGILVAWCALGPTPLHRWLLAETWASAGPVQPGRLHFFLGQRQDVYHWCSVYAGHSGAYRDACFVNGYSPMVPVSLERIFGFGFSGAVSRKTAERIASKDAAAGGTLDWMGVEGLILGASNLDLAPELERAGWRVSRKYPSAWALQKPGQKRQPLRAVESAERAESRARATRALGSLERGAGLPFILARAGEKAGVVSLAPVHLSSVRENRNEVRARVEVAPGEKEGLVVYSRAWVPGYRAALDGRRLEVETLNLIQPAVRLPPGASGELVLAYRPAAVRLGIPAAWLALLLAIVLAV